MNKDKIISIVKDIEKAMKEKVRLSIQIMILI